MEKKKKLPLYNLMIDDNIELGVSYVALVDDPAIEINWMAFNNQIQFKADTERRIITGALMLSDTPIYRRNESMGEFNVIFDKHTIEKIVQRFMKNDFGKQVNAMHDPNQLINGVYMYESFITDKERGIQAPKGFEKVPEGSWFGSYKVENEDVWQNFIKTGEFKGFSVEGAFDLVPESKFFAEFNELVNSITCTK